MRFLVDTNVFLDTILKRENHENSDNFFAFCCAYKNPIYITSMSLRDIRYVVHRIKHDEKQAIEAQMKAYRICSKVVGISADDAIESLYSDFKDYEDSLINEAAKSNMVDAIITNNKRDFIAGEVPTYTPEEILKYTGLFEK